MKRLLFTLAAVAVMFLLVFNVYASDEVERWILLGQSKDSGSLYVEVTTYNPLKGAWYRFERNDKRDLVRIIEERSNKAICFNAFIEKDVLYDLPEKQCAIVSPETISETIFMSLLVIRNEYEKKYKDKK